MQFNSMSFAIFLPIVFVLYWAIPYKFRWALLLASSYYFYMSWNAKYIVLILFTTVVSYLCAVLMERVEKQKKQKILLVSTLVTSLGVLFFFKYFNFFSNSITDLLSSMAIKVHPVTLAVMLPVGISFYTFQTLSYVIDVYRGEVKAEKHFGYYAAFISFFPQLVAGPIERTRNLLPQIQQEHKFNYEQATYGMKLMAWGFFKKMVIADCFAVYVDQVYSDLTSYRGFAMVIAAVLFTFQIYGDFSGYSDIAIGTAKLFGIELMNNFKSPYFAASIREFWGRWHISLSTWFRDYIYIPLGGNRVTPIRHKMNLMITFLVSGLWHGASWTYLFWGGIHGGLQVIETSLFGKRKREIKHNFTWALSVAVTFILVCIAWIFFRAERLEDAYYVIMHSLDGISNPVNYVTGALASLEIGGTSLAKMIVCLGILFLYDFFSMKYDLIQLTTKLKVVPRWALYYGFVLLIFFFMEVGSTEFIYFEF